MSHRHPRRSRRPRLRFSAEEFERMVEEAVGSLPEEFAELLDNVVVTVEEEPGEADLASMGLAPDDPEAGEIFGLYVGVALTERDTYYSALPDRIAIYSGPILRACATRRQAVDEIRKTVLHELGHYFGMGEEDMPY